MTTLNQYLPSVPKPMLMRSTSEGSATTSDESCDTSRINLSSIWLQSESSSLSTTGFLSRLRRAFSGRKMSSESEQSSTSEVEIVFDRGFPRFLARLGFFEDVRLSFFLKLGIVLIIKNLRHLTTCIYSYEYYLSILKVGNPEGVISHDFCLCLNL